MTDQVSELGGLVSYSADLLVRLGQLSSVHQLRTIKESNDNISNGIFSPVTGTTNLVVEEVTNLVATGANDMVTLPEKELKLTSGKTVSFGDV